MTLLTYYTTTTIYNRTEQRSAFVYGNGNKYGKKGTKAHQEVGDDQKSAVAMWALEAY